jgi:hypothetical protein
LGLKLDAIKDNGQISKYRTEIDLDPFTSIDDVKTYELFSTGRNGRIFSMKPGMCEHEG